MKVLGLIPARRGSKGLPGKNTRLLAGASLIERAFRTAAASRALDRIILSTDDPAAADIARACGLDIPFERPAELAADSSGMLEVVEHALESLARTGYRPDAVLILQPTSPLRTPQHIIDAVAALDGYTSVCSVVPLPPTHNPHYVMRKRADGCLDFFMPEGSRVTRRQDAPQAYVRDGTIYLTDTDVVLRGRSLYGDRCRPMILSSDESLSIDSMEDWEAATQRLQRTSSDERSAH